MNTVELKKMITTYLVTKTKSVFEAEAPAKASYPYVVYALYNSTTDTNEKREDFELIVDIYDNNQFNSQTIDELAGNIDGDGAIVSASGLHRKHYYSAGVLQADIYRINRQTILRDAVTEGDNIRHIQLTYDVFSYLV